MTQMKISCNHSVWLTVVFIWCLHVVESRFHCHKRCSGHGYCSDYDNVCQCEVGYQGVGCTERTCPLDFAWADKPYRVDIGHARTECSGAGKCNRRTGVCECSPGFTGIACEYTKCGGSGFDGCNGHGDCLTLRETYLQVTAFQGLNTTNTYDEKGRPRWESTHTTMCSCHPGFAGASCEYRLCPKGDDQLTPHTGYRTISITVNSESKLARLSGSFQFQFNGESFLFPTVRTKFTAVACKAAFEALRNIKEVTCEVSGTDYETTYVVSFLHFPVLPYENNIFSNDGNPPLSAFSCNMDRVVKARELDGLACVIGELDTDKTYPEYAPCSNRGVCDFTQGVCYCFEQFEGASCGSYKKAIAVYSERAVSTSEVLTIESSNEDFDRTVLQFQTFDIGTQAFDTVKANNLDRTVFQMDGYGNVNMHYGGLVIGDTDTQGITSGMTVDVGGLTVTGGITAKTDTLVIDGPVQVKAGGVEVAFGGATVVGDANIHGTGAITGGMKVSHGLNISQGLYVAAGGGTVSTGGLYLNGGLTIFSAGLTVNKRGVTIYSGGLVVTGGIQLLKARSSITVGTLVEIQSDGFKVTGGITALNSGMAFSSLSIGANGLVTQTAAMNSGAVYANGGLTVATLGMVATGGMTVNSLGMYVQSTTASSVSGLTVYDSGVLVTDGLEVASGGLVVYSGITIPTGNMYISPTSAVLVKTGVLVTGGLSVGLGGLAATGGLTVYNLGMHVDSDGLTISGGGLRVTGGMSITTDGLRITGGVTVNNNGFLANDKMTIVAGGLSVFGGMTVSIDGLAVTNGVTIGDKGFRVTNGVSILSSGLMVTGGLTVTPDGLVVTGGATLYTKGLRITGGLTNWGTSGFTLTGGLSVQSPGLTVTAGVTVYDSGLNIVTNGLTVQLNGLLITSGLSIMDSGLTIVAGGLSVQSGSLRVTGGLTIGDAAAVMNVVNAMTVYDAGRFAGGWTVNTAGMMVGQGVTVSGSGLAVTGGVSFFDGGVVFAGTVSDLGMTVTAGLSISSTGVAITTSGLTIPNSGVAVTGGVSVQDSGLTADGGLTIRSTGMRIVSGGAILGDGGLTITGGLTIARDGFTSAGTPNFYISSGGLAMADQLKVGANGARVTGGLTLSDTGISMYSLIVRRGGVKTSGAIQDDGGLVVYGDSTVKSAGIKVTGGMTVRGGMSFSSSTSTFVNSIDAGAVIIKGATAVEVRTGGLFSGEGLTVNGAVYLASTSSTISDARLKTNVSLLGNPLDMLATIRGVYYNWKDSAWDVQSGRRTGPSAAERNETTPTATIRKLERASHDSRPASASSPQSAAAEAEEHTEEVAEAGDDVDSTAVEPLRFVGLLAQQVQSVLPEAVSRIQLGGASYLGVKYSDLVALLIEAIKEIDNRTSVSSQQKGSSSDLATLVGQGSSPTDSSANIDESLLRTYFEYESDYGNITAVKPYAGTCECAPAVLSEIVIMLRRLRELEIEEARLTERISSLRSS